MSDSMELSIVIPALNESESLGGLIGEIVEIIRSEQISKFTEIIIVDDGSTDATADVIQALIAEYPTVAIRHIQHARRFGQTAALSRGFNLSRGTVVVAIDGDGQNDPSDIPRLVEELAAQDVDCASGWRIRRSGDRGARLLFSRWANSVLAAASGVPLHDFGCTLKAYRGDAIRAALLTGDQHRIIPSQLYLQGGSISEVEVNHRARTAGKSHYSLMRTFRVAQDIIVVYFMTRFMSRPMHVLGGIGSFLVMAGIFGMVGATLMKLIAGLAFVETPILLTSLIMLVGGVNLLGTGLLAEMLNRAENSGAGPRMPLGWVEL